MKKLLALSLTILFLFLCGCNEKTVLEKGDMLYDLGIETLGDIDHCGLWYFDENTPKPISAKITKEKDYEFLSSYKSNGNYDKDKIHELFALPGCQRITLKSEAGQFLLYVFEDGTIVAVSDKAYTTCVSDNPITFKKLKELAKEYELPEYEL